LGSVVQLLPKEFTKYPGTQGMLKYNFASNGRGHVVHARVENSNPWLNARLYATYKNAGDLHTPNYFLTNTGQREANVSVQLNKNWNNKWLNDFNYSLFTSEIGLLRGSHIGNLTDLQTALKQPIPFFTEDEFSRNIRQPSQKVQHHQAAYDGRYIINANNMLQFKSSWQWNKRQEFDVRRGGRSEMPALSLSQHTFWNEVAHTYTTQQMEWSSGIQYQYVNNTNVPETGILPLIPDYFHSYTAAYSTLKFNQNKWQYEAGLRGGVTQYEAFTITQTLPREVLVVPLQYTHAAASAQVSYLLSGIQTLTFQTGFTKRPPEIHELFSFGLHQGISSIEEGDASLRPEYSWKSSLQWELRPSNRVYFSANIFYQKVADFIYLQPQEEFRLTIRGAFPVFIYQQHDAQILGSELYLKALLTDHLEFIASYSIVRGRNTGLDVPLVYMPSDVVRASISYEWSRLGRLKQPKFQLSGRYVAEQSRLLESQDFLAPPPAYFLLNLQASTDFIGLLKAWNFHLRVENVLNTVYRDYLNRQRYFADEMGINIMMGFTYSF
jgi:iron complex outermembrane receptor protein